MAVGLAPAVFLDKDGTLVADVPYSANPQDMRLLPGVAGGLRMLYMAGYRLLVVSNQSGVARGYFPESALQAVEKRLRQLLQRQAGVPLAGFYYCPHHPQGVVPAYTRECDCRKPRPGLLLSAAAGLGIDLSSSWMIGDILNDVEAGKRAGCRAILINNGGETEWLSGPYRAPDGIAADMQEAAQMILSRRAAVGNSSIPALKEQE